MKSENMAYLQQVREELEAIYSGRELDDDGEPKSFYDFLCDAVLDYDFTLDSQKELCGCRLWVTIGGPAVWVDTNDHEIKIVWGADRESLWLPSEICDEINEMMAEVLQC